MRNMTSPGLKSLVCAGVAVTLTALLAGVFDLYAPYIRSIASDAIAAGHEIGSISAILSDARDI